MHQNSAMLLIKWSKTLQASNKGTFITLPLLGQSPLCPLQAIQNMIQLYPASDNAPLFFQFKWGYYPRSDQNPFNKGVTVA